MGVNTTIITIGISGLLLWGVILYTALTRVHGRPKQKRKNSEIAKGKRKTAELEALEIRTEKKGLKEKENQVVRDHIDSLWRQLPTSPTGILLDFAPVSGVITGYPSGVMCLDKTSGFSGVNPQVNRLLEIPLWDLVESDQE